MLAQPENVGVAALRRGFLVKPARKRCRYGMALMIEIGIIYSNELDTQKKSILCIWYAGKEMIDTSLNKVISVEGAKKFIHDATDFVAKQIGLK